MDNKPETEQKPNKIYTGVWIPAWITERKDLSPLEKWLWAEVAGFGECWASNAYLAQKIGVSERWVSACVSKLTRLGMIKSVGFNGRFRCIRAVTEPRVEVEFHPAWKKSSTLPGRKVPPENKVENKESTNVDSTDAPASVAIVKSDSEGFGNREINELFDYWERATGVRPMNRKSERFAAYNLLRKFGADKVRGMVDAVARAQTSRYAPRIATISALQRRLPDLIVWVKQSRADESAGEIISSDGARLN